MRRFIKKLFKKRNILFFIWDRLPNGIKSKIKNNYKLNYQLSFLYYILKYSWRSSVSDTDLVLVSSESSRGWILDAICHEIAKYYSKKSIVYYSLDNLPDSNNYFFSHYSLLPMALKLNPKIRGKGIFVYYTHPRELAWSEKELAYAFNQTTKVICMCSLFEQHLRNIGVSESKVTYVVAGADDHLFQPHKRQGKTIGLSTAFYERKAPDRILELIKLRPDLEFILLGRNWSNYRNYQELISQPNLEYVETDYLEYPNYYQRMSVFVSPAILEGGPIPLLEAMMSNVVPVASKTGFAPDVIDDGRNGYLFPVDATAEQISELINKALLNDMDIRSSVESYTWKNFANKLERMINESY